MWSVRGVTIQLNELFVGHAEPRSAHMHFGTQVVSSTAPKESRKPVEPVVAPVLPRADRPMPA
jgi:hypothetical protein